MGKETIKSWLSSGQKSEVPVSDISYVHHEKDITTVIRDVLGDEPEETFYFLNEGRLRENVGVFRDHFLPEMPERRIIYAMKANPRERIMRILKEEGIDGFDCASANEATDALKYTHSSGVYFNHPIKTSKAISEAYAKGVRYFTAQLKSEVEKIMSSIRPICSLDSAEIAVRLKTLNEDAVIDLSTKYGAEEGEAREMLMLINSDMRRAIGALSINTGSQNKNPETFARGIEYMADIARSEGGVSSINIGGGIPVNYHKGDNFDTEEYLRIISQTVRYNLHDVLKADCINPKVIIEPGRSIVGSAVDLVIPVLATEERDGNPCVYINDGVFGSFSDFAVHGWQYNFDGISRDGRGITANKKPCVVYGNTCDSGDNLGKVFLPESLKAGDFLWVKKAGAYMDSQSSRFNGINPPKYISYNTNP